MKLTCLITAIRKSVLLFALLQLASGACSQSADSTKHLIHFKSAVSVTNNGFSFIPSFTLGKPAAIVDLSVAGKRFSFEPQLRFSLEGKPWSFIFIWRYKLLYTNKFQLTVGTHLPAINFKTIPAVVNGESKDVLVAQRFLPFELLPNYRLSKSVNISLYYLYARGLDPEVVQQTHFLSCRANFSNIRLSQQWLMKFNPQLFYLSMDENDGFYAAASLTLAKRDFPLSISAMMNKALRTDIAGKDFNWNVSLVYSFEKNYVAR